MKQTVLLIALVVSVCLNLGAVAMFLYQGCAPKGPEPIFAERLELTPEQKETLAEKREEMKKKTEPVRRKLDDKRSEVIELMKEPELDTAKRDALFEEIADLQAQLEILVFDHMYETAQVLTPGQREIFFEQLDQKFCGGPGVHRGPHGPGRRGEGFGPGFRRGPGPGAEFGPPGPPPLDEREFGPPPEGPGPEGEGP